VAVADAFTTDEDVVLTGNVATNDTPSPDGGNVWTKLTDPAHGSAVVGTGGVITYTPATNYNGSDSFVYKLCDGDGDCVTALVTITVNSVNDLPVANVDNVNAIINAGATGTLATNDILSGDGGNVFTKKTDPLHGTVTVGTNGTFTYTPVTDYTGSDSFIYELCDANNDCDTAIVKISVFFNPYPTANVDVITTAEDTPYSGSVAGNDYPSSDGGEVFNKFTDPLHGTVIMGVTGTFTYTPAANYNGSDSFIYKVCDANNDCDTAIVKITVTSVNDLPVAAADAFSTNEDTPLSGSVSGNDSPSGDGGNVWSKSADPAHGTVVVNANGAFTYTPAANYNGPDSFKYKVCDIDDECSEAEVTITVVSVNDLPVAMVDYVTAVEDTPLSTSVAGNDVPSGDGGNVWSKHSDPAHGTVIVLADGSFTYSPAANYYGSDSFVYKLCDADSDCDTAIVKITVTSVDEFPTAVVDYVTTNEDTPFTGSVTGNDTPSNDGGNVWSKQSDPAHGLIAVTSDGGFTYTPVVDFNGNDSFVYKICDTDGDCDTAIVRITVTSVNDVPAAKPDDFFIKSGGLLTGNLARNDINSGDGGNVWSLFTPPSHGSATVSPEGLFTYISEPDYIGLDSFVYQLCDVNGDCVTAVVNVDVYNAPPELKLVEFYCVYLTQYGKWTLNSNNKRQITAGSTAHFGTYNDLTFAFSRVSFNCSDVPGPLNIEVTASDERGSTTTGHFRLYVLDTIPPVAMCKNADLYLDNNGQAYLFQGQIDNGSSDNCGIDEIYLDKQLFTTADIGVKKVTLTVVDRGGNTAQCTASVTVHPRATVVVSVAKVNLAPTIADIKDISIGKDALSQEVALTYITAGETDGSQKVTSVTAITDNTQLVTGIKVIYWDGESTGKLLITAASGVSGEAMVTIIVKDNGGTGNGGVDTFMKTFKVIVNTINTPVAVTPVGETNAEVVTASIDYRDEFGLKFWPNPTRGPVNIDLTGNNNNPVILKVYTIQGVELFMRVYPAGEPIRFDLAGKVTGIYVIELSTGMKTINRKIVLTD